MARQQSVQMRPLLEGALLAAIAVVLTVGGTYLPLVGPLLIFVWPVPFAVASYRQGLRMGVLTVLVAGVVSSLFVGFLTGGMLALVSGSTGLAFGYAFQRRMSGGTTILLGSVVILIALGAGVSIVFFVMGQNPIELMRQAVIQSIDLSSKMYAKLGWQQQVGFMDQLRQMTDLFFGQLLPAMLALAVVVESWLNFSIMRAVFTRLNYDVPRLTSFSDWQLPYWTVWIYVVAYGGLWVGAVKKIPYAAGVGQNLMLVMMVAFVIQGMSFASFFLIRWHFSGWAIPLVLGAAVLNPLFSQILFFAGMFETVIQYRATLRERDKNKVETNDKERGGRKKKRR